MSTSVYPMNWNLEVFFPGGAASPELNRELEALKKDLARLRQELTGASGSEGVPGARPEQLDRWTEAFQSIADRLGQVDSFAGCLLAQNVRDTAAAQLNGQVQSMRAEYSIAMTRFEDLISRTPDSIWDGWVQNSPVRFYLNELRQNAKEKLSPELEAFAADLAVDGYHGWGNLYNTIVSRAKFRAKNKDGQEELLSAGQMYNRLSDADRSVRAEAFTEWEREWSEHAQLCADALNHIAGFRLKLYDRRGWNSVLKEPLKMNRMSQATLDAMWAAINDGKQELVRYFERKAKLLGVEKLDWHDITAPLGSVSKKLSYDDACKLIIEQFQGFDPKLARFTEMAFKEQWIEAEDRPGKRPGGFCTTFPVNGETRIFMTYSGTVDNVSTLAHELGHAYHSYVMEDLPSFSKHYAMNVAETASTFAEIIVAQSQLEQAESKEEKIALLELKIQNAVAFYMNIHARLLFELSFYEERRNGEVSVERLNELMTAAQREAYSGVLGEAHPHFWAAKLHFFFTDVPFYNFPYTFGYMFSAGIYARAKEAGSEFAGQYVNLLRDTGSMTVEELALKHMGVNLQQKGFWESAVAMSSEDIRQFLELTEN
ncbi:M3 family oligoendopeptidase [Paenibacillus pasadenensis]|uniref:M3 family oligoendopeptidase n=1 Tax=Paenibacillus pasadenensis TaxID=217090 RepID=UPI00203A67C3|nr:M3 family oligoendopeptidase [Paenibacillus pasadenensis]MCM3749692.1 M3 family oligoendopeptidase [Paenibacillus pasadenensis]